jgi:hypothetical protein
MDEKSYPDYLKAQSYEDLVSIRNSLDKAAHPDRYAMVIPEIETRGKMPESPPSEQDRRRKSTRAATIILCLLVFGIASTVKRLSEDGLIKVISLGVSVVALAVGIGSTCSRSKKEPEQGGGHVR